MPYWLTNPEHGVMPVYNAGDIERNAAAGWTLLNEGESPIFFSTVINGDVHAPTPADVIQEQSGVIADALPMPSDVRICYKNEPASEKRKPGRPPKVK